MMPETTPAYRLFSLCLALLVAAAVASLWLVARLIGGDALIEVLTYADLDRLTAALLSGALHSGLLGGGLCLVAAHGIDAVWARRGVRLWAGLALALPASILLDMRLDAPLLALHGAAMLALALWSQTRTRRAGGLVVVWAVGAALMGVGLLLAAVARLPGGFFAAAAWAALADGLRTQIGAPMAAVALLFWLMHRFSNITPAWAGRGVYVCGGLVALAGAWQTLPAFYPLSMAELLPTVGAVGVVIVPACAIIIAAHAYRALSDRNPTATLAGGWAALGVVALLAWGIIGGLQTLPALYRWTAGSPVWELSRGLAAALVGAILLGALSQTAAELRSQRGYPPRRIIGLLPFWCVAGGFIGAGLAWGAAGIAEIYLERAVGIDFSAVPPLIAPLLLLCWVGLAGLALGLSLAAVALWARRPGMIEMMKD